MLLEPPRPHVPARGGLTLTWGERLRIGAGAAALVLALTSRGDALVLAALAVIGLRRPVPSAAVTTALLVVAWRWGSSALEAWAGGQAVLGPAGWVDPPRAAAAMWLAAVALVASAPAPGLRTVVSRLRGGDRVATVEQPRRTLATTLVALALGVAAGVVVAGPSLGGRWWQRVVATIVGALAALAVQRVRQAVPRLLDGTGAIAAVGALVLVTGVAPGWDGTLDMAAARSGAVIALAVGAVGSIGGLVVAAMGQRGP